MIPSAFICVHLRFHKAVIAVSACISLLGCGQSTPPPAAAGGGAAKLEVLRPQSGGEMLLVPSGQFVMGDGAGRADETPHPVSLSAFYVDRYLVTQELYEKVMSANPSKRKGAQNPVEQLRWTEAARFCNKCSELEGLTPCYDLKTWECNFAADGYRLPTEAEWEYACRAGSAGKYCCGDDPAVLPQYAWFKPHSRGTPKPVGQKAANRWGLYDVHGNVYQWCNDLYGESYYKESPKEDPKGPQTGNKRVLRGGAWDCTAEECRAAYRFKENPAFADACFGDGSYGFRRVRSAAPASRGPRAQTEKKETAAAPQGPLTLPSPARGEGNAPRALPAPTKAEGKTLDLSRLKGTIVFVSDRGGTLAIWRMHASGKNQRQLTHDPEADADPRFSPDGQRISYTSLRGGFPEVWLMSRDGSAPKRVTEGSQADWAPDGQTLVFIRDNRVWVRTLASGAEKRISPEAWERCGVPAYSPDGKRIALASRHLDAVAIFILGCDGKESFQLKTEEPACTPHWSRDCQRLLCQTTKGQVFQVGIDGRGWEQMTFGADVQHEARYSPDGSMLIFCRSADLHGPWQICLRRLDGDEMDFVPLTTEGSNLSPDWQALEE
ncbi:MAG: SUMF1/EgtB/PvdO family nonheme iron enzyme [Planctomycetota bacterium]